MMNSYLQMVHVKIFSKSSEFQIISNSTLGWNRDPYNIQIGRIGLVGPWYKEFYIDIIGNLTSNSNHPTASNMFLWTDAINATVLIQVLQDQEQQAKLLHDHDDGDNLSLWSNPPTRQLLEPLSKSTPQLRPIPVDLPFKNNAKLRLIFQNVSLFDLNGLVSHRDGGCDTFWQKTEARLLSRRPLHLRRDARNQRRQATRYRPPGSRSRAGC